MPTTLQALQQFGRYRIVKLLGSGAMGSVYLARDLQLEREVALKVPQFAEGKEPEILARFYQEARAAATIHHPNVCPVFDVGENDGVPYLTMAYIEGKPLEEWVSSGKPLNERQIATIGRKVADALNEAHKKGVLHRDLKPSNIMIDKRGEPIVMDFGLAQRAREDNTRLTRLGTQIGSPAYMSPEQIKGETNTTGPGTDVFSLGVILYELLARRLPFDGDSVGAVHAQILLEQPPPLRQFCPDVSPALEAICVKALAKKAEERYPSMAQMSTAIKGFLNGSATVPGPPPTATRPALPPPPPPTPTSSALHGSAFGGRSMVLAQKEEDEAHREEPRRKKKRKKERRSKIPGWVLVAGTGVGVVALLVGLALVFRHDGGKPAEPTGPQSAEKKEDKEQSAGKKEDKEGHSQGTSGEGSLAPSKEVSPKKEPEIHALFNDVDFRTDWEPGPGTPPNAWKVEKGNLVSVGADPARPGIKDSMLLTKREFKDFVLTFDFQASAGGLSGVTPRAIVGQDVQIGIPVMDDSFPRFRQMPDPTQTLHTGAIRFVAIDKQATLSPRGDWNFMEVRVRWPHVRVIVNHQETVTTSLNSDKITKMLNGPLPQTGKIGLLNSIGTVRYRNIRIQELAAPMK